MNFLFIRSTWTKTNSQDFRVQLVFLLGKSPSLAAQVQIERENNEFNDIVQGDFVDSYRNLSYKSIMANTWVSHFCRQAEFVLKVDDDMFVDMYELFVFTRQFLKTNPYINSSFLVCPVAQGGSPNRDPNTKWYVSYEDLSKSENGTNDVVYPPYCSGNIHLTNLGTAAKLVRAAESSKPLPIEDVWVTGYLAQKLGIQHFDIWDLHSLSDSVLLLQKIKQNTEEHTKDFLCGLINRDFELSLALTKKAEWCYNVKCNNSFYYPTS